MGEAKRRKERTDLVRSQREGRQKIFERIRLATVAFGVTEQNRKPKVIGSGVIVDRSGVVVTARHVVQDLEAIVLKARQIGKQLDPFVFVSGTAQLEITDQADGSQAHTVNFAYTGCRIVQSRLSREVDLAVVAIATAGASPSAARVSYDLAPQGGDPVATCGWPYGLELDPRQWLSSFLTGTVSAVIPHPAMPARHRSHYLMQLPVNPGNSGGPVFDPDTGDVYGIVSSRYEPRGIPAGLSVIEPIFRAEQVVQETLDALRRTP